MTFNKMSAIDLEMDRFFGEIASIRMDINVYEEWCRKYEAFEYPKWKTKDGNEIALSDMSDTHLANTISMLEKIESDSGWLKAMKQERKYRIYKCKIKELQNELTFLDEISSSIF